jgi:hypothetical protein
VLSLFIILRLATVHVGTKDVLRKRKPGRRRGAMSGGPARDHGRSHKKNIILAAAASDGETGGTTRCRNEAMYLTTPCVLQRSSSYSVKYKTNLRFDMKVREFVC